MSFEPDSKEYENETENLLFQIAEKLDKVIFLLELIANVDVGSTQEAD